MSGARTALLCDDFFFHFALVNVQAGHVRGKVNSSSKMRLLHVIAATTLRLGEKLVVFSQSIATLNTIEKLLRNNSLLPNAHGPGRGRGGGHSSSKIHLRVDGSTPLADRFARIAKFNDPTSPITVLLVSTKACGEGVNMVRGISETRVVACLCSLSPSFLVVFLFVCFLVRQQHRLLLILACPFLRMACRWALAE